MTSGEKVRKELEMMAVAEAWQKFCNNLRSKASVTPNEDERDRVIREIASTIANHFDETKNDAVK